MEKTMFLLFFINFLLIVCGFACHYWGFDYQINQVSAMFFVLNILISYLIVSFFNIKVFKMYFPILILIAIPFIILDGLYSYKVFPVLYH
jgi:hypothetical protein